MRLRSTQASAEQEVVVAGLRELGRSPAACSGAAPSAGDGLLQTHDYATAVFQSHMRSTSTMPPGEPRRRVEARMRRQEILTRASPASPAGLANVTLQILTLEGNHPIGTGSFAILRFAPVHGAVLDDVVYVEELSRSNYVEEEDEAYQYQLAFERLQAEALSPDASRELIARIAGERWA